MYETHFGLAAPPFAAAPDPALYFDGRGHHSALAYLRYGLLRGEGFIVLTGDIGAGKTLLVRRLLGEADPAVVLAVTIACTPRSSSDLMRATLDAFGVAPGGSGLASDVAALEAFLRIQAAQGRRALLVVDEAQHLDPAALELLRQLSNLQSGSEVLLQIFLVGQPALAALLAEQSMAGLRQRLTASCHLGALPPAETRAYVEHRLRAVGWRGHPAIDAGALDRVHHHAAGIPRLVNRLMHRVLLAACLEDEHTVGAAAVDRIAAELRAEPGLGGAAGATDAGPAPAAPVARAAAAPPAAVRGFAVPAASPVDVVVGGDPETAEDVQIAEALESLDAGGVAASGHEWLCIADSTAERLKAGALARGLAAAGRRIDWLEVRTRPSFPDLALSGPMVGLPMLARSLALTSPGRPMAAGTGLARRVGRLSQVLRARRPAAVAVFGSSEWATTALFVARRLGLTTVRVVPSVRPMRCSDSALDRALADVLAEHVASETGPDALQPARAGLLAEVLAGLQSRWPADADLLGGLRLPDGWMHAPGRYVVAVDLDVDAAVSPDRWLGPLTSVGRRLPVLWWVSAAQATALHGSGWLRRLAERRVHVLADIGYLQGLRLLRDASALIGAGSREWAEEADAFGVPRLDFAGLHQALLRPGSGAGSIESMAEARARGGVPLWSAPVGASGRLARELAATFDEPIAASALG